VPENVLDAVRRAWEELRPLLRAGPCRACECLHGLLAALRLALEELPGTPEQGALRAAVSAVRRPAALHPCLGCQPCGPGAALAEFSRAQRET